MPRDVGDDVKRHKMKVLASSAEKDFMNGWLLENQENFVEVMKLIEEGNPVKYAEIYLKAYQMGVTRETNVNINVVNRQKDREELQALVRTRVSSALPYTPYEEVVPKKLNSIKLKEGDYATDTTEEKTDEERDEENWLQ